MVDVYCEIYINFTIVKSTCYNSTLCFLAPRSTVGAGATVENVSCAAVRRRRRCDGEKQKKRKRRKNLQGNFERCLAEIFMVQSSCHRVFNSTAFLAAENTLHSSYLQTTLN